GRSAVVSKDSDSGRHVHRTWSAETCRLARICSGEVMTTQFEGGVSLSCGTIRWFDARRGYGFIIPRDGGPDVFLHRRVLQQAGLRRIAPGAAVCYEAERTAAGIKATGLRLQGNPPLG
ncbi:MAG TPA: cold shock domain-containing protein, partial [bacterium]|nr:cold shock domain-containing protein [bacterium]